MIMTNKLLPVALIAALVGGSVGALVMHSRNPSTSAASTGTVAQDTNSYNTPATPVSQEQVATASTDDFVPAEFNTAGEQTAYKVGFADGFRAADAGTTTSSAAPASAPRVVYRNAGRSYARSSSGPVYAQQPRKRSFWQKHRDKLTVAIGAGSGAAVGGLIGGKKGAAIGALAGAGGSALWTYKLRDRSRRY